MDPVQHCHNGVEWVAWRDPEGLMGVGPTAPDAHEDLARQEADWQDEQSLDYFDRYIAGDR